MTVSDLDSGYWHVPTHADFQKYLGIHYIKENGQIIFWVWTGMPLGIVDATFIFTKITKPIMSSLRLLGKRSSNYIDDVFNSHQEEVGCALQEKFIHEQFFKEGWVRYLGIIINSVTMNFEIPEDKLAFILEEASFLLNVSPPGSENSNP